MNQDFAGLSSHHFNAFRFNEKSESEISSLFVKVTLEKLCVSTFKEGRRPTITLTVRGCDSDG